MIAARRLREQRACSFTGANDGQMLDSQTRQGRNDSLPLRLAQEVTLRRRSAALLSSSCVSFRKTRAKLLRNSHEAFRLILNDERLCTQFKQARFPRLPEHLLKLPAGEKTGKRFRVFPLHRAGT